MREITGQKLSFDQKRSVGYLAVEVEKLKALVDSDASLFDVLEQFDHVRRDVGYVLQQLTK